MELSVVMPIYNERKTLQLIGERVLAVPMGIELICVDDDSRNGSRELLVELQRKHPKMHVFLQPRNMGNGVALRRGIQEADGEFVVIQDADLEYDPADYGVLLDPLVQGNADVVYGSRFLGNGPHRVLYEVGISYSGRTYEQRKKIGWRDGLRALWCLVKYSIREPADPLRNPCNQLSQSTASPEQASR